MIRLLLKLLFPSTLEGITRIHSDLETEAPLGRGGGADSRYAVAFERKGRDQARPISSVQNSSAQCATARLYRFRWTHHDSFDTVLAITACR